MGLTNSKPKSIQVFLMPQAGATAAAIGPGLTGGEAGRVARLRTFTREWEVDAEKQTMRDPDSVPVGGGVVGQSDRLQLSERLIEEGEIVARQVWDSGGPGSGLGEVTVEMLDGRYYALDDMRLEGPFDDFLEAAQAIGLYTITEDTVSIWHREDGFVFRCECRNPRWPGRVKEGR